MQPARTFALRAQMQTDQQDEFQNHSDQELQDPFQKLQVFVQNLQDFGIK